MVNKGFHKYSIILLLPVPLLFWILRRYHKKLANKNRSRVSARSPYCCATATFHSATCIVSSTYRNKKRISCRWQTRRRAASQRTRCNQGGPLVWWTCDRA